MEQKLVILADSYQTFQELMRATLKEFLPTPTAPVTPEVELLSQKQAMALLGIAASTIIEWKKEGLIPYKKIKGKVFYEKAALLAAGSSHEKYTKRG